jgi:DNA polymerase
MVFNILNKKEKLLKLLEKECLSKINDELSKNAKNLVFGKGNSNAKILFIGEAPGAKEDELGLPFVGRAGKELDKMLNKINLNLTECYIANILKFRPPKNRDPNKQEIINHTPFLIEQIKIIKPKIIITLGNYSTKFVLGDFKVENMKSQKGISQVRAKIIKMKLDKFEFSVFPIYHPSAMMYKPSLRETFEKDFIELSKFL